MATKKERNQKKPKAKKVAPKKKKEELWIPMVSLHGTGDVIRVKKNRVEHLTSVGWRPTWEFLREKKAEWAKLEKQYKELFAKLLDEQDDQLTPMTFPATDAARSLSERLLHILNQEPEEVDSFKKEATKFLDERGKGLTPATPPLEDNVVYAKRQDVSFYQSSDWLLGWEHHKNKIHEFWATERKYKELFKKLENA